MNVGTVIESSPQRKAKRMQKNAAFALTVENQKVTHVEILNVTNVGLNHGTREI